MTTVAPDPVLASIDAELSVLGAIMLDPDEADDAFDVLGNASFAIAQHRCIFEGMVRLRDRGGAIDPIALRDDLDRHGTLTTAGGVDFLARLMNVVPTAANVGHHARIVQDYAMRRRITAAAEQMRTIAADGTLDVDAVVGGSEAALLTALDQDEARHAASVRDLLGPYLADLDERRLPDAEGIATGLADLDAILGRLRPGDLVIVAARPSVGKSAFAWHVAQRVTVGTDRVAGMCSLEMSETELVERAIAAQGEVALHRLRDRSLRDTDYPLIAHAASRLQTATLEVCDRPGMTVGRIRSVARRWRRQHGRLDLVVVDYLQLMLDDSTRQSRNDEVAAQTRALKNLARELEIPIVLLSQLSRRPEERPDQRPRLSDLRDSGAIEQDADIVVFLWNDPAVKTFRRPPITAIVAKHRNGPLGDVRLRFSKQYQWFDTWTDPVEVPV